MLSPTSHLHAEEVAEANLRHIVSDELVVVERSLQLRERAEWVMTLMVIGQRRVFSDDHERFYNQPVSIPSTMVEYVFNTPCSP